MKNIYRTIRKAFPFVGARPITEDDCFDFCSDHKIELTFTNFVKDGLYLHFRGHDLILINPKYKGRRRLHRLTHEIGHYLLHGPLGDRYAAELFGVSHFRDGRRELEADTVAALLMLTPADLSDPVYCGVFKYDIELRNLVKLRENFLHKFGK